MRASGVPWQHQLGDQKRIPETVSSLVYFTDAARSMEFPSLHQVETKVPKVPTLCNNPSGPVLKRQGFHKNEDLVTPKSLSSLDSFSTLPGPALPQSTHQSSKLLLARAQPRSTLFVRERKKDDIFSVGERRPRRLDESGVAWGGMGCPPPPLPVL